MTGDVHGVGTKKPAGSRRKPARSGAETTGRDSTRALLARGAPALALRHTPRTPARGPLYKYRALPDIASPSHTATGSGGSNSEPRASEEALRLRDQI